MLALFCVAALVIPLIGIVSVANFLSPLLPVLRDAGVFMVPPYILLAGLAVGFALAPTHLTSLLSGYLFGAFVGIFSAVAVIAIGTIVGFFAARKIAKDRLRELLETSRWGYLLAEKMIDASPWKAGMVILLARLPPQIPFAVGNLLAASARIPFASVFGGTLLGMLPRVILVTLVGSELAEWQSGTPLPSSLLWTVLATFIGFGSLILWSAWQLKPKNLS